MFANYEESVRHFVSNDQGFLYINFKNGKTIKVPNIFIDIMLHWSEMEWVCGNYFKIKSLGLSLEDIERLKNSERWNILNSHAVVFARHFQHRVDLILKEMLLIRAGH